MNDRLNHLETKTRPGIESDTAGRQKFDQALEFVSLMVHDLQGPIASMKTLTRILASGKYNSENDVHAALVRSTKNALERAESIISDLIESAGKGDLTTNLDLKSCDLRDLVADSVIAMGGSAFDYGVSIGTQLPDNPVVALVDKNYLLRVFDNLFYNAFKHTPRGKQITAAIEPKDGEFIITVSDEGAGFGNMNPETLFDKYYQLSPRSESKYRGVGLGLYFCRLAITAMGGKIWAEHNPGGGACFKISLSGQGKKGL